MPSVSRLDFSGASGKPTSNPDWKTHMLHKLFQWWYDKTRSSYGQSYRKIDNRSKERDLINYFHDFGGDGMNTAPLIG